MYLFDISPSALECSRKNRDNMSLDNVEILRYDMFSGLPKTSNYGFF